MFESRSKDADALSMQARAVAGEGSNRAAFAFMGALALIALLAWLISGDFLSLDALIGRRAAIVGFFTRNPVAAPLLYVLAYSLVAALSIPGATLMTLAGGFLFGGLCGGALASIAATLGATCLFVAMRAALGPAIVERIGPRLKAASRSLGDAEATYLLTARLVPIIPFWLVNIAAGLSSARLLTFVWTTFVGIVPVTFFFAFAGAQIDAVFGAEIVRFEQCVASGQVPCHLSFSAWTFVSPSIFLVACGLAAAAWIPATVRYAKGRRHG